MKGLLENVNGTAVCNFVVKVISMDIVHADGIVSQRVRVRFDFGKNDMEEIKIYDIPLDELDKKKWKDLDVRCRYNPEFPEQKIERYINDDIRAQIEKAPRRTVEYLTHAGMHRIAGQPVFCTGKIVIQSSMKKTNQVIEVASMEENLDVNYELTEFDAVEEMIDFIGLSSEAGRVLLAYKLLEFMRMAYEDIGKMPNGCIYLYGETGIQKTTFSSLVVQTYNRSKGIKSPPRLSASIPAAVQILKEKAGDVAILDDLFPADSGKIRSQMEETLSEIVRYIADGTLPAKMRGKKLSLESPKCGVIFTGEYIIGKGSDAARILPVKMVKPDGKKLQYFQEHPVNISTFYYYYISWFIEHYDEACEILKKMWDRYETIDMGVHDRLREMHFFLSTSYFLFLQYCFEKGFLTETDANRMHQSFNALLTKLVRQQNERVKMGVPERSIEVDYWSIMRGLYKNKQFHTADDVEVFDKNQHDSVIRDNCLYFRRECLKGFFPNENPKDIIKGLEQKGILQAGKNAKTKQISKLNGMRFYVIPLKYLI